MLLFSMPWSWLIYVIYLSHCIETINHWGRVTHMCVSKLTSIGSDNGLSPGRRQAIIWINAGILLIRPLRTNFSEILIKIDTFSFKKIHLKMSSAKWQTFCLGLNVRCPPLIFHEKADATFLGLFYWQKIVTPYIEPCQCNQVHDLHFTNVWCL